MRLALWHPDRCELAILPVIVAGVHTWERAIELANGAGFDRLANYLDGTTIDLVVREEYHAQETK